MGKKEEYPYYDPLETSLLSFVLFVLWGQGEAPRSTQVESGSARF